MNTIEKYPEVYSQAETVFHQRLGAMVAGDYGERDIDSIGIEISVVCELWSTLIDACESPIELRLAPYLATMTDGYSQCLNYRRPKSWGAAIFPQYTFQKQKIRVDFLIECFSDTLTRRVIVECDGHDFHERTKEQAAKDRSRDRLFQEMGAVVLRYTGQEICRDPEACVDQIELMVFRTMDDILADAGVMQRRVHG